MLRTNNCLLPSKTDARGVPSVTGDWPSCRFGSENMFTTPALNYLLIIFIHVITWLLTPDQISHIVMTIPSLNVFFLCVCLCTDGHVHVLQCRVHHPGDHLHQERRSCGIWQVPGHGLRVRCESWQAVVSQYLFIVVDWIVYLSL